MSEQNDKELRAAHQLIKDDEKMSAEQWLSKHGEEGIDALREDLSRSTKAAPAGKKDEDGHDLTIAYMAGVEKGKELARLATPSAAPKGQAVPVTWRMVDAFREAIKAHHIACSWTSNVIEDGICAALQRAPQPPAGEVEKDAARFNWIVERATCEGGGTGFELKVRIPVDHEDISCAIDIAIDRASTQPGA